MTPYDTSWTDKKDVNLRDYTNIYVTRNVDDPLGDSIKLGFTSNVDDIKFQKDKFTYFHFPLKKEEEGEVNNRFCGIEETTLINDGATYGSSPYKSDRIYKIRYNYEDSSPYGKAQPENFDNGKWLCSWLSGNVLNKEVQPVWMDRWFDPSMIPESDALRQETSLKSDTASVYDVPSNMSFDFGAYYKYWRVGNKTINDIVDHVINVGEPLKIHCNDWKSDIDIGKVTYINLDENSLNNYRVSDDFDNGDYGITFNGKNQMAIIPYDDDLGRVTDKQYSIVFWVRNDSWADTTSYGVIDNMCVGGWRFGVTNHADNLFIYLFGNDPNNRLQDGTSCLFNAHGDLVSTKAYWKNNELNGYPANIKDMLVDLDNYSFVLDVDEKENVSYIRKLDYYGNQLGFIKLPRALKYLDVSNENHGFVLYAYTVVNKRAFVYKINRYTLEWEELSNEEIDPSDPDHHIQNHPDCEEEEDIDPNVNVVIRIVSNTGIIKIYEEYFNYSRDRAVVTDNGNDTVDGIWLDRDQNLKYHSFAALDDVICVGADHDNNIWVLHSDSIDEYCVTYHTYQLRKRIKIRKGIKPTMMDFISRNVNGKNVDYILIVSNEKQCVYVYDMNGEYIDVYDSSKFYVKPNNVRFCTSYEWYRRNRYLTDKLYFDVFDSVGHNRITRSLDDCPDKEWHQVAATVGMRKDGRYVVRFFFDCQLVGEKVLTIPDDSTISTYYRFDSPIVVGGTCGKFHPLSQEINVDGGSYSGSIDDVRIYSRVLTADEMYYIYMTKYACEDLIWHLKNKSKNYVENINKFYKFKMPGSKSAQYVLHIKGYKNKDGKIDDKVKEKLEGMIHKAFKKVTPAYTSLLRIIWD